MTLTDRLSDCLPKVGEPETQFCVVDTADLRAALEMLHHGKAAERERCAAYLDECKLWRTAIDIRAGVHAEPDATATKPQAPLASQPAA